MDAHLLQIHKIKFKNEQQDPNTNLVEKKTG